LSENLYKLGFSKKIQYYLVHSLGYTNRQARALIGNGSVRVDGRVILKNEVLDRENTVLINGRAVRMPKQYVYVRFYKPRGFESTLSEKVPANISHFFKGMKDLSIAGRLDKDSEGLLLLSNDGRWVNRICDPGSHKEKEYLVDLEQVIKEGFVNEFAAGVLIGGEMTRPCCCEKTGPTSIRVILTEGKNRQIRRMCRKLGNEVIRIKRVRIDNFKLDDLSEGELALDNEAYREH
jgi:23S rRNA pseudouridine2604 synthase